MYRENTLLPILYIYPCHDFAYNSLSKQASLYTKKSKKYDHISLHLRLNNNDRLAMVMERDADLRLEGTDGEVGAISYREGKRIGSGHQICKAIQENTRRDGEVIFTAPWKSKGDTSIVLEATPEGYTTITRSMESALPRFLFWMKSMMVRMIGKDYMRGLKMLQTLAETGNCIQKQYDMVYKKILDSLV